jgi:hypothetical protein
MAEIFMIVMIDHDSIHLVYVSHIYNEEDPQISIGFAGRGITFNFVTRNGIYERNSGFPKVAGHEI